MPEKSAEHIRIEGLVKQYPEGTRKGDDARARLRDIEKNRSRTQQITEGKGQFIPSGLSLKEKRERRQSLDKIRPPRK